MYHKLWYNYEKKKKVGTNNWTIFHGRTQEKREETKENVFVTRA